MSAYHVYFLKIFRHDKIIFLSSFFM